MLLIPGALFALIGLHLYLVIRLGVTSPPWSEVAAGREREPRRGPGRAGSSGRAPRRPMRIGGRRAREQHKRYKEDVEREGKPFFPYAMFHDTVMSLVVVVVIIALACVWYFTRTAPTPGGSARATPRRPTPGRRLHPAAGLVLLLPLLPAPDLQVAGHGDPRHRRHPDFLLAILLALPFIDIRRERRLSRRPVAP